MKEVGSGGRHAGDGAAAVAGGGSGGKLRVRVEVTLTGVCHCPQQIISNAARYILTPLPPQPSSGREARNRSRVCVTASTCADELVFVPAFRIMHPCGYLHTHPTPSRGNGRSLYIFSFNALRDLASHLAALLRDCLPIFATLVIEPLTLRRLRQEYG